MTKWLGKWAVKEALGLIFVGAGILAKIAPIYGGDYRYDAVLYMIIFGLAYFGWEYAK